MRISVDTDISVLSSRTRVHKTDGFLKETCRFCEIDTFLTKLSEAVMLHFDGAKREELSSARAYKLETADKEHTFFFEFGLAAGTQLASHDIVFFRYIGSGDEPRRNDQRLVAYLHGAHRFDVELCALNVVDERADFKKLFLLSNNDSVNFPLLNEKQLEIVMTEDRNMLVQGVAGSGKTNVCIDKIVYCACREYKNKVLYSTFSRGLLVDTQTRVNVFRDNLRAFVKAYREDRIIFLGDNKKHAIENRLGVYFFATDDDKVCDKIERVADFLDKKVDYALIEDVYSKYYPERERVVGESYFTRTYVRDIRNHQLSGKLAKISHIAPEVIYKEIYGLIFGSYDVAAPADMLTLEKYTESRKNSFSAAECDIMYQLAKDYGAHMQKHGFLDNNIMSRRLLSRADTQEVYSIAILDEVQDMTEVNLCLMKRLASKLFCVGDALQMINPSYFGFAYLKRLLFEQDAVSFSELSNNYRNTRRIAEILAELEKINLSQFGTHSFVLKGESVDSDVPTSAVYVEGGGFADAIALEKPDSVTFIVGGVKEKDELRRKLPKQEILTVSEVKGLERDVVVLCNLLSDNADKWHAFERTLVNRKTADENSVYRYYFNLFYVGVSRAKAHLVVWEEKKVPAFSKFLNTSFKVMPLSAAVSELRDIAGKIEVDDEELSERVRQFISLEQFDNARLAAAKLTNDAERTAYLVRVDVHEAFVHEGKYRDAGIAFWEANLLDDAKHMFRLSGDDSLCELIDACGSSDDHSLNIDIVSFFPDVEKNDTAKKLIVQTVKKDLKSLRTQNDTIHAALKRIKENANG